MHDAGERDDLHGCKDEDDEELKKTIELSWTEADD
jgi:hypothetical protein